MTVAELLIADLAKTDPRTADPGCGCCSSGVDSCYYCGVPYYYSKSPPKLEDHATDCLWRRAKELF